MIKKESYNLHKLAEVQYTDENDLTDVYRSSRHIAVAHMIRLYQCQNGIQDEQFADDDAQEQFVPEEEEDNQNEIQEALRSLGIEDISVLEQMGLDLN